MAKSGRNGDRPRFLCKKFSKRDAMRTKIIAYLIAAIVVLGVTATYADEPIAPDGITYVTASDAVNQTAHDALQAAFSGDKLDLASLISKGIEKNGKVLLGVYLSQTLAHDPGYVKGSLADGEYQLPLSKKDGVVIHAMLLAANKPEQVKGLSDLLAKIYAPVKPFTIRKLTKDEMALIWFYVSWDLTEPLYVVEGGGHRLVFQFDPSGTSLSWIEDMTAPCFRLSIRDSGLPCMCHLVVHEGNKYSTAFQPMKTCAGSDGPGTEKQ